MVDYTRWNTGEVLAAGVLNRPMPKSSMPKGVTLTDIDQEDMGADRLRAGLEAGGLKALQYYGNWAIWKVGELFDGELMQYRNVTDQFKGLSIDAALEKAEEWGALCYG